MIEPQLLRFTDAGLGNDSYLVVAGETALVVDPVRDVGRYLDAAEAAGAAVTAALETHLHADFVSGSRELGARGARVFASAEAGLGFPVEAVGAGDEIAPGGVTLRVLATPGHTPEHVSFFAASDPPALFSGGALIPGGAARTDLLGGERTEELARRLYRTLHETLAPLPDETVIYATHGAGSLCSASTAAGERSSTLGRERAGNPLLQPRSEEAFVQLLLGGYGLYPPYFLELREVNRAGALGAGPVPPRLSAAQAGKEVGRGAWPIDVRPTEVFAEGHVERSISLPLTDSFPVWLGWMVPWGSRIVIVAEDERHAAEAARRAGGIGYEDVAGWIAFDEAASSLPVTETETIDAEELERRMAGPSAPTVVDVRRPDEVREGIVPGARIIEAGRFATGIPEDLRGPIVSYCRSGHRSMIVASLLERAGAGPAAVYMGGEPGWRRSGRPLARP